MKISAYILVILLFWPTLPLVADDGSGVPATKSRQQPSKLNRELAPRPYSFDDYVADLKQSARRGEPKRATPVTEEESKQVAANKYRDYKPLNPFVIEW